jgi:oligopeptide transport system substrate-binding protein
MSGQEAIEHQQRRIDSQRLIANLREGRISRRDFVVRAATLGFSGAAINVFLIACSVGNSPPTSSSAPSSAPTAAVTPTSGVPVVSASPTGIVTGNATATRPTGTTSAATATRAGSPVGGTPTPDTAPIATAQGTQLGGAVRTGATLADTQELRYPLTELVHADPGQATSIFEVQFILQCWDGLLTANQQGDPTPAHATKYDISADGLTYTFTLRPGLKFSDGTPLTANDYEWTWKRNISPDTASEYAPSFYAIKGAQDYNTGKATDPNSVGVKATNATTLVVTLAAPAPYFLTLVSTWVYVPLQRATIEKNAAGWVEVGKIVTAGAYKLQDWTHNQRMVLVADSNYYGDKPSLQKITYVLYPDIATAALPAYQKGDLDVVNSLSADDFRRVKGDATLSKELNLVPSSGTGFIVFDTTNAASPVGKKEFRQAVYYALNRDNLCTNVLGGQFLPKATLVPEGILGYQPQPPLAVTTSGDKAKARQLLQAAGYAGEEIVFTHSDAASAKAIAQAVQSDLKDVGVTVRLAQLDRKAYAAWREARGTQAFGMYFGAWFSDYEDPNDWYNTFFGNPAQEYWKTHYPQTASGKAFVTLIATANAAQDRTQRRMSFEQAEQQLLTDLPLVPVYGTADAVLVKPYVKGLVHTRLGQDRLAAIKILKH